MEPDWPFHTAFPKDRALPGFPGTSNEPFISGIRLFDHSNQLWGWERLVLIWDVMPAYYKPSDVHTERKLNRLSILGLGLFVLHFVGKHYAYVQTDGLYGHSHYCQ